MRPGCCLAALIFLVAATPALATDFYVYYLGGQSNMDGFGYNDQLPEGLAGPLEDLRLGQGGRERAEQRNGRGSQVESARILPEVQAIEAGHKWGGRER